MTTKYGFDWTDEAKQQEVRRLINQLWKLIPMKENQEDWNGHLVILIEELSGLVEIYNNKVEGIILLAKLEGLTDKVCDDFMVYRKTVFRCIDLLSQVIKDE